ncbi:aminoacyl-tRNA hydrolase [Candidatus Babeliales bacterium]|nr:aminoacyl-tRNA hydrolase [Candidatus Babeliales bacterium]
MSDGLSVKNGIVIPLHELEITSSRAGGPGGQHVNKTSTRITVRWHVPSTTALDDAQKARVMQNLQSRLTVDGDLIVHNSASRSQQQNKEEALLQLAQLVRKALHVPKKRIATKVSKSAKEARLKVKSHKSTIKKMRSKRISED